MLVLFHGSIFKTSCLFNFLKFPKIVFYNNNKVIQMSIDYTLYIT